MSTRTWMLIAALCAAPLVTAGSALAQETAPRDTAPRDGMDRHGVPRGHGAPRHRGGPEHRVDMLVAILGLDAQQEASVRQIVEANAPRRTEIRQMTDEAARHAAMRALHESTRASIAQVLTPAQRATLDRIEAVRREHGPRGRRGGPPPSAPSGI